MDKLVQALETDAAWVEVYGVTGELVPSKVKAGDDKLGSGIRRVLEVSNNHIPAGTFLTALADSQPEEATRLVWRVARDCHPRRCPSDACQ